jgi:hypothetical protein
MAERNVTFNVNPDEIQVEQVKDQGNKDGHDNQDLGNQDNQDGQDLPNVPNVQNNDQAPQINIPAAAPGAAQMTLAFKVEQSKDSRVLQTKGQR